MSVFFWTKTTISCWTVADHPLLQHANATWRSALWRNPHELNFLTSQTQHEESVSTRSKQTTCEFCLRALVGSCEPKQTGSRNAAQSGFPLSFRPSGGLKVGEELVWFLRTWLRTDSELQIVIPVAASCWFTLCVSVADAMFTQTILYSGSCIWRRRRLSFHMCRLYIMFCQCATWAVPSYEYKLT